MSHHRPQRNEQDEIEDWVRVLERVPFLGSMKRDFVALRRLLYDRRAPRIAVVGSRGSGRTSLANALLAAVTFGPQGAAPAPSPGRWVRIDADGRRLDWLELPSDDPEAFLELAHEAFEESRPDVLVGVLEAGTDPKGLATTMAKLHEHLEKRNHQARRLVLLTKVDTLPPTGESPPYSARKRLAIDHGLDDLRAAMRPLGIRDEDVLPVCARPYDGGENPRYNVDGVGEALLTRLPEAAQMEAVRAFEVGREARRDVARALVNSCSTLAVTIGIAPVPFADVFVLVPLQAAMVTGIAYLSGRPWDRKAAMEWIASVGAVGGAGLGLRWGAQQLVKLVPGAGSIVGASVAGAGTLAIGRSAMSYFIDGPGSLSKRLELRAENPA